MIHYQDVMEGNVFSRRLLMLMKKRRKTCRIQLVRWSSLMGFHVSPIDVRESMATLVDKCVELKERRRDYWICLIPAVGCYHPEGAHWRKDGCRALEQGQTLQGRFSKDEE